MEAAALQKPHAREGESIRKRIDGLRTTTSACLLIFLCALGVRVLAWHDSRYEFAKVQSAVTGDYKRVARLLLEGGVAGFFSPASPLSDLNTLGHPPGYSILLAFIYGVYGESNNAIQFTQMLSDGAACVVIFLIAAALLPRGVGVIAGMLAALSPQFAWNSVLLLPDTLAVLFVLLALYCLVLAAQTRPRLFLFVVAGMLVGISCWIRANAMLLAPFLAAALFVLFERGSRLRFALALVAGAVVVIAPLTIRNAVVYRAFIPLSLGAGQTLLEGIADYDRERSFGIPDTDLAITRQEAATFNRPDYAESLFGPEGVERERMRLRRGFAVIRENPLWFSTVMVRRAASMLRLERVPRVTPEPHVTHALENAVEAQPVRSNSPAELLDGGQLLSVHAALARDGSDALSLTGDDSKYEKQFAAPLTAVEGGVDYVFEVPLKIERGRMSVGVESESGGKPYASTTVETIEGKTAAEQPRTTLRIPFVSRRAESVRLVFSNAASNPARPLAHIGTVRLFALGAASNLWTRYPRLVISNVQKLFITAFMLPPALLGCGLLLRERRMRPLAFLLVVPVYYFCVQSILHTEYRYVLAVHYFLFVAVAVSFYRAGGIIWSRARKMGAQTGG